MNAFYGVCVTPKKAIPFVPPPEEAKLHLSQATLEGNLKAGESVTVWAKTEDTHVIICRLTGGVAESIPLDLIFDHYTEFEVKGSSNVHLTGYYIPVEEDEGGFPGMMGDEDMDDEDEDEDEDSDEDGKIIHLGRPPPAAAFGMEDDDDEDSEDDEDDDDMMEDDSDDEDGDGDGFHGGVKIEEIDDDDVPVKAEKPSAKKATPAKAEPAKATPASKRKADAPAEKETPAKAAKTPAKAETPASEKRKLNVKEFDNGFKMEDLEMGKPDGKVAKNGQQVIVRYKGWLASNNKVFDETKGNATFKFRLGVGEVIKGWDRGVVGMRVGDKRRLTVPPQMGYGAAGAKPAIPGNATLMFDVTLVDVKG